MIRPLSDRVFVRPAPRQTHTAAGLEIPDTGELETVGDVVAVGDAVSAVKVGERVLIAPMSGIEASFNQGEHTYIILGEDEILGVFE